MSELQIRLLGEFQIRIGNETLPGFQRSRLQAFLAYLLLKRGEDVSRQQLAYLFWPDSTEKQARTNIRNILHQLRRSLPESDRYLQVTRTDVQWLVDSPYWLDVAAFEAALEEAKEHPHVRQDAIRRTEALYRGELLPQLYEGWVLNAREEYHQRFMTALETLLEELEVEQELAQAITYAQRLLKLDPLREETYRTLMRLYSENGDRAHALQTYHVCETILNRELGVGSSQATVQAYRRLFKVDSTQTPSTQTAKTIPLIGRQKEWQTLFKAWQRSQKGHPHLVLLNGQAGVGKSRLANELVEKVRRQGIGVANARAYKSEGAPAFAAVMDLFQSETIRETLQSLDPVWKRELAKLMPDSSGGEQRRGDIESDPDVSYPHGHQLFEALTRAVIANRKPILIHIDDVHWCDSETLSWLHYLLRFDATIPLLVLVTARPENMAHHERLPTLIRALHRENLLTEIVVEPLDQEETGLLAAHLVGQHQDTASISTLFSETEGNPLFIVEMVQMGIQAKNWDLPSRERYLPPTASLPPKLQAVIETRLAQLSPVARELAGLASVFGRQFSIALLIQACTHDEETVVKGIDELWQRRIVQEVGFDAYYFTHGKLRAVAYASLSKARRQTSHRRIAAVLEANYGQNPQFASHIARHLIAAGERDEAVQYDLIAGDAARVIQANQESVNHYLRALSVLEENAAYDFMARTWNKLGLVYHLAGDYKRSDEAYERAFILRRQLRFGRQLINDWSSQPLQTAMLDPRIPDSGRDNGRDAWLIDQLFSGLVTLENMDVTPDVAQTWQVSEDGRIYTFHLRAGLIWSDSEPVQAHDFVYAWKRVLDPKGQSPYASLLYGIVGARAYHETGVFDPAGFGVRAVDTQTLEVELVHPDRNFLYVVAHRVSNPVPAHVVKTNGASWTDPATLVGNGPFVLESWEPGEQLRLLRNPGYHRQSRGNVERVQVTLLENWSGQVTLFEQNELDVVTAHNLTAAETLRLTRNQKLHETWASDLRVSYVAFDTRQPPFDDVRVRKAFVLATDRVWLAKSLLDGYNLPATGGFLPLGLVGHTADLAPDCVPERAQELLAEAGYPGGQGMPVLQCVESRQSGLWRAASELLREQWRRNLGVIIHSKPVSRRVIIDRLYGDAIPQISFLGWRADYPDPDNFMRLAPIERQTGWRNPEYDRYVQEARTCLDRERRLALYQQADRLLMEEAPIVPLTYHRWQLLFKPWVQEHPASTMGFWDWKDVILAE